MLDVNRIQVHYRGFSLGPVSFQVEQGEFLSVIGTNGAGKSTLISAILGLNNKLLSGSASFRGNPLINRDPGVMARVGYVTDSSQDILPEFTAIEYFRYCRMAYERARQGRLETFDEDVEKLSAVLGFPLRQSRQLSMLSLGTRRKAQIIAALIARPSLIFLDEAFIGLDFVAARSLESLLRTLKDDGVTCVMAGHDLDLASRLADKVLLLHEGRVSLFESVSALGGVERLEMVIMNKLRHGVEPIDADANSA
jgi:ABC-type multidrug transport system ATPase subunit